MKGIFCTTNAKTNEEYKKTLKARMNLMVMVFLLGLCTVIITLMMEYVWKVNVNSHMMGFYCGIGTGLSVAGAIIWIKHRLLLNNEEKLRESRLSNSDERLQEISRKSLGYAGIILLVGLYLSCLIGGFFYPELIKLLAGLAWVYVLGYFISYKILEHKM